MKTSMYGNVTSNIHRQRMPRSALADAQTYKVPHCSQLKNTMNEETHNESSIQKYNVLDE